MKILHILGDRKLPQYPDQEGASGIVRVALEIARIQVRLGHDVTVATVGRDAWSVDWSGVHLATLATLPWARIRIGGRSFDFSLHLPYVLFVLRHPVDIIHGHSYGYMRFLRARIRLMHFHSDPLDPELRKKRLHFRLADFQVVWQLTNAQVVVNRSIAAQVIREGADPSAVHVVYNGVDLVLFESNQWHDAAQCLRREWGVAKDDTVFLYAGATVPYKGVIHLARAFVRLAKSIPSVHLALAGGSSLWGSTLASESLFNNYEAEVRAELRGLYEAGRVHYLGKVAHGKMPITFAACDVVVLPSIWHEPFPLAALEAMAAGRPVIASATGGIPELVSDTTGSLVPPGDEEALQSAMRRLAYDAKLRWSLGFAAREAAQSFTWDVAAHQLDGIYRNALRDVYGAIERE